MPRRHGLSDEIAVLDGLDIEDGRIGRTPATGAEYAEFKKHSLAVRRGVLDPSEGANYGGGSSFPGGKWPLLPSTVGLADNDLVDYSRTTGVLPPRKRVIDPSQGALYTGGSSHYPGGPLVVSSAGLADARPLVAGGYGRAGLGRFDTYQDFDGVPLGALDASFGSSLEIEDGRIGRTPASQSDYANRVSQNFYTRSGVLDFSEGANYGGGSSFPGGKWPLLPSTVGLAELSLIDGLDQMPDTAFARRLAQSLRKPFVRFAGRNRLRALKGKAMKIKREYAKMTPSQKVLAKRKMARIGGVLKRVRGIRRGIMAQRLKAAARRLAA